VVGDKREKDGAMGDKGMMGQGDKETRRGETRRL